MWNTKNHRDSAKLGIGVHLDNKHLTKSVLSEESEKIVSTDRKSLVVCFPKLQHFHQHSAQPRRDLRQTETDSAIDIKPLRKFGGPKL